ncbi:MAG: hypothetical protein Q7U47_00360 [Paludibacter sp.]|nr:hypothetical protein [Paludibacter sp.]
MKSTLLSLSILFFSTNSFAQSVANENFQNTAEKIINSDQNLSIGGYGEVHYNQTISSSTRNNATLDVHRMVLFFGYNFSKNTKFVTEVEMEYTKELWVEQLFLQHKINEYASLRAGLLLIPMGIINEHHEPTTFNGVERPLIDNKLAPSTWREIGLGLTGNILPLSLKYQAYLINGSSSYDGNTGFFNSDKGMRDGRQKGSKSYMSTPNFTGKIEYYGIRGLNIGFSGYVGNSQSKLYDKLDKSNTHLKAKADSSVVGISMIGLDSRYNIKGIELRGQFYYTEFSNTKQYNQFTKKADVHNNLANSMLGYYVEAGYNVLRPFSKAKMELIPFIRFQNYNMQLSVNDNLTVNNKYIGQIITTGLTLKLAKGAVLKTDVDFAKTKADAKSTITLNAGLGISF